ncbi:MAG TPA: hypothetical protein VN961_09595 [Streptosporangiaceae bacterium]|nr:hypothetical protein [Streptosporangiaceae bacterium]
MPVVLEVEDYSRGEHYDDGGRYEARNPAAWAAPGAQPDDVVHN